MGMPCECRVVTGPANLDWLPDGERNLIIVVPFPEKGIEEVIRSCDKAKKSVTLVNGDIVADVHGRFPIPLKINCGVFGPATVKGGVNLWISKPDGAGLGNTSEGNRTQSLLAKEIEAGQRETEANYTRLATPIVRENGVILHDAGKLLAKETVSALLNAGCQYMSTDDYMAHLELQGIA